MFIAHPLRLLTSLFGFDLPSSSVLRRLVLVPLLTAFLASSVIGSLAPLSALADGSISLNWTRAVFTSGSSSYSAGEGVAVAADGSVFMAYVNNGSAFLRKYDASGNVAWNSATIMLNGAGYQDMAGVTVDSTGNAYATGYGDNGVSFIIKYNGADGSVIWRQDLDAGSKALAISHDDASLYVVIFDANGSTGASGTGWYLAKYSSAGNLIWMVRTQSAGSGGTNSVAVSADDSKVFLAGGCLTGGTLSGNSCPTQRSYLLGLSAVDGGLTSLVIPSTGSNTRASGLAVDPSDGSIYLGVEGTGGFAAYLNKYAANGTTLLWSQNSGFSSPLVQGVTMAGGNVYIAGNASGSFIAGFDTAGNAGPTGGVYGGPGSDYMPINGIAGNAAGRLAITNENHGGPVNGVATNPSGSAITMAFTAPIVAPTPPPDTGSGGTPVISTIVLPPDSCASTTCEPFTGSAEMSSGSGGWVISEGASPATSSLYYAPAHSQVTFSGQWYLNGHYADLQLCYAELPDTTLCDPLPAANAHQGSHDVGAAVISPGLLPFVITGVVPEGYSNVYLRWSVGSESGISALTFSMVGQSQEGQTTLDVNASITLTDIPTNATTLVFDVTFNESVNGLAATDFSNEGTATGCLISVGSPTANVYPVSLASCSEGTVILRLAASGVTDTSGNANAQTDGPTVTVDRTDPSAPSTPDLAASSDTGSSDTDNVTADDTPTFTGTSETGSTVKIYVDNILKGSDTATGGTYSITTSSLNDGVHAVKATATDTAGNTSADSGSLSVTIDTAVPTSLITSPVEGFTYTAFSWNAGCLTRFTGDVCGTASDSGPADLDEAQVALRITGGNYWTGTGNSFSSAISVWQTATGTSLWSLLIPYSTFPAAGSYMLEVRAIDLAGNEQAPVSSTFTILNPGGPYTFEGFFSPVNNPPVLNQAQAGRAIPVKWRITKDSVAVSNLNSFVSLASRQVACGTMDTISIDAVETYVGSSGLIYQNNGNWQFNWVTPKSYVGQCRIMTLTLNDGSTHDAYFQFK